VIRFSWLEVRRLVSWYDDKFHDEVTQKLLYEPGDKKVMKRRGVPDSRNVRRRGPTGAINITNIDYMAWLLDQARPAALGGDEMR